MQIFNPFIFYRQVNVDDDSHNDMQRPQVQRHLRHCFVNKSTSMPNLKTILNNQLQISDAISNSSVSNMNK